MFLAGVKKKYKRAFSLIEMLIFLTIFVFSAVGFYRVISSGMHNLTDAKNKIAAAELANERLEIIRNMPYEDIGVDGSIPAGELSSSEEAVRSNTKFTIATSVKYVDDEFDELAPVNVGDPGDAKPNDYKEIELIVRWDLGGVTKNVTISAHIAPPGTEELYTGGILAIEVRDSAGNPVQGATVEVTKIDGGYTSTDVTGADGKDYLIGLTAAEKVYKIRVSKGGYYTVETMAPYNSTPYDPMDEHASVVQAAIWPQTIEFNRLASISVRTRDPLGNNIPGIDFTLEGGRKLGDTVPDALPVYSYAATDNQTDAEGIFDLNDLSAGPYIFTLRSTAANSNYEFWKMANAYSGVKNKFFADPGVTTDAAALLLPKNIPSALLTMVDKNDGTPLSEVQVELTDSLGNEQIGTTDQFGQVYLGNLLANGEYQLHATVSGYEELNQTVTVSDLTKPVIQMEKN